MNLRRSIGQPPQKSWHACIVNQSQNTRYAESRGWEDPQAGRLWGSQFTCRIRQIWSL